MLFFQVRFSMNRNPGFPAVSLKQQSGAVLFVSLILLLVMTVLATSNMRSTSMELRMATNNQARQQAFQAAETALRIVEDNLEAAPPALPQLRNCASGTASCYEPTCEGGLCFKGSYPSSGDEASCDPVSGSVTEPIWKDTAMDVWNTSSKHRVLSITDSPLRPKYVVEFLCYVDDGSDIFYSATAPTPNDAGSPVFRITALASSEDEKAKVMLQSTYKLAQ